MNILCYIGVHIYDLIHKGCTVEYVDGKLNKPLRETIYATASIYECRHCRKIKIGNFRGFDTVRK